MVDEDERTRIYLDVAIGSNEPRRIICELVSVMRPKQSLARVHQTSRRRLALTLIV
jgi:hypothetical protein